MNFYWFEQKDANGHDEFILVETENICHKPYENRNHWDLKQTHITCEYE